MDNKEKQIKEQIGIVKAISKKDTGWNSFTLRDCKQVDGVKDIWFTTKKPLEFEKGDEIKFTYIIDVGEIYTNYKICEFLSENLNEKSTEGQVTQSNEAVDELANVVPEKPGSSGNIGKNVTQLKAFENDTIQGLVEDVNKFNRDNDAFSTQPTYTNPGWAAIVYHKTIV